MRLLAEIERDHGVKKDGKKISREAVRAIIMDGSKLLMLHSSKDGDYHFPGGGIDPGESHNEALARELLEECGAVLEKVQGAFGKIIEYGIPKEKDFDVFCMTSHYYFCEIGSELGPQTLEDYEVDLGLEPRWVEIDEALRTNERVLVNGAPPWTMREVAALGFLREKVLSGIKQGG